MRALYQCGVCNKYYYLKGFAKYVYWETSGSGETTSSTKYIHYKEICLKCYRPERLKNIRSHLGSYKTILQKSR